MKEKIEFTTLILTAPLFRTFSSDLIIPPANDGKKIDAYCLICKKETTLELIGDSHIPQHFHGNIDLLNAPSYENKEFIYICKRCDLIALKVLLNYYDETIVKYGQMPSPADFFTKKSKEFKSILGVDRYKEYNTAILLNSQGYNIGSFAYLRRIFEYLIERAHKNAQKEANWDENNYKIASTDKKIMLLRKYLPFKLVQNKDIYKFLSAGIHNESESECKAIYDVLLKGIDIIIEEKVEMNHKEKREKIFSQQINALRRRKNKPKT